MWKLWKRVAVVWAVVKDDVRLLWAALLHPRAPRWLKLGAAGIVLYLLMPLDLIPDFIPVVGLVDDLVLLPMAMRWLYRRLPADLRAEVERQVHGVGPADAPRRAPAGGDIIDMPR